MRAADGWGEEFADGAAERLGDAAERGHGEVVVGQGAAQGGGGDAHLPGQLRLRHSAAAQQFFQPQLAHDSTSFLLTMSPRMSSAQPNALRQPVKVSGSFRF